MHSAQLKYQPVVLSCSESDAMVIKTYSTVHCRSTTRFFDEPAPCSVHYLPLDCRNGGRRSWRISQSTGAHGLLASAPDEPPGTPRSQCRRLVYSNGTPGTAGIPDLAALGHLLWRFAAFLLSRGWYSSGKANLRLITISRHRLRSPAPIPPGAGATSKPWLYAICEVYFALCWRNRRRSSNRKIMSKICGHNM